MERSSAMAAASLQSRFVSYRLEVPNTVTTLTGRFSASGGTGNDVEAWVTNEDGLVNFRNRTAFRPWYRSGRSTQDTLQVNLHGPGVYHLIFDNRFAWLS